MQLQITPFFGKRICKKQWNFLLASLPQNILPAKCYIQIHISDFHGKCRHELGYNLFYAFYVALFISQRHQITSSMGPQFIHIKMYILSLVAGRNCGANININPKNSNCSLAQRNWILYDKGMCVILIFVSKFEYDIGRYLGK